MGIVEARIKDFWIDYYREWEDASLNYMRYLQGDIAFLKTLLEGFQGEEHWEMDLLIREIIWDEGQLISSLKQEVLNARQKAKTVDREGIEGVFGRRPNPQLSRNGTQPQKPENQPHQPKVQTSLFWISGSRVFERGNWS